MSCSDVGGAGRAEDAAPEKQAAGTAEHGEETNSGGFARFAVGSAAKDRTGSRVESACGDRFLISRTRQL